MMASQVAQANPKTYRYKFKNMTTCRQWVMLPHDIVATLWRYPEVFYPTLVGAPGDLESYWDRSSDLEEAHADMGEDLRRWALPLRLYGDAADSHRAQNFELTSLLPVLACASTTQDTRLVLAVRSTVSTSPEASHVINHVLAWSFEALRRMAAYVVAGFAVASLRIGGAPIP